VDARRSDTSILLTDFEVTPPRVRVRPTHLPARSWRRLDWQLTWV